MLLDDFKRLWRDSFNDPPEWIDNFLFADVIANDSDIVGLRRHDKLVSALALLSYRIHFHSADLGLAYISGAATRRNERGRGHMSRLVEASLKEAFRRGDTFCALIPADSRLYLFYRRFGMVPSFYVHTHRYTALHPFDLPDPEVYTPVDPTGHDSWDTFRRLEQSRPCRVIHSRRDWTNALRDLELDGGHAVAVAHADTGRIEALAMSVEQSGMVYVKDILAENPDAYQAVLRQLRGHYSDRPFTVLTPAGDSTSRLLPRGMVRVVNAYKALEAVTQACPKWRAIITVDDPVIEENRRTWHCHRGTVTPSDREPDMTVDISTLTTMLFAAPAVGDILGIPSTRPEMALMLD